MKRILGIAVGVSAAAVCLFAAACSGSPASDLTIERLPDVSPSLPAVPTLPPPPFPVQLPDQSYTVYGLRRRQAVTMGTDVSVTGYIVEIYAPPECEEGRTCPTPAAPHMWIADTRGEADSAERLMVVSYAENQQQIDEAVDLARRGRYEVDPEEVAAGIIPVPVDFFVGNKVVVRGRFARISGSGFNVSEGLLDYAGHTTSEITPEAREALGRAAGPEPEDG
jgi:hypothetical protein